MASPRCSGTESPQWICHFGSTICIRLRGRREPTLPNDTLPVPRDGSSHADHVPFGRPDSVEELETCRRGYDAVATPRYETVRLRLLEGVTWRRLLVEYAPFGIA